MAELQVSGLIHVFQKDPPLLDLFLPLLRFRRRVLWSLLLLFCCFKVFHFFILSFLLSLLPKIIERGTFLRRLLVLLRPPFFFLFLRFLVFSLPGDRVLVGATGAPSLAGGGGGGGGRVGGVLVKAGGREGPEAWPSAAFRSSFCC